VHQKIILLSANRSASHFSHLILSLIRSSFAVTVLLFSASYAQDMRVTVLDAWSIERITQAKIFVGDSTFITDENGQSDFNASARDSFFVVEAEGYFSAQISIADNNKMSIYLQPVESSAPIIVVPPLSGRMPAFLPANISVVSLNDLDRAKAISIEQAIGTQSGITNKSYGADGQIQAIALRGMAAEQTQVLYDGIPLNSLQLGAVDFSGQNINQIGAVEIYRGSSPLFGGTGAIAGTINLKPPKYADQFEVGMTQQVSSLQNYNTTLNAQIPIQKIRQYLSLSFNDSKNSYATFSEGQKTELQNRDFSSRSVLWQVDYPVTEKIEVDFLIRNFKQKGGASRPFSGANAESGNKARKSTDNTLARIRLDRQLQSGNLEFQLYRRNEWNSYRDRALDINSLHLNKESGAFTRARYLLFPTLLLNGGLETAWQKIESSDAGMHSRTRWAAYVLADWLFATLESPALDLHLNLSGRFENVSGRKIFIPGVGISASGKSFSLYASAGKNHRLPGFNDLYWPALGNPNLKPERSINVETGLSLKKEISGYRTNFKVSLYRTWVSDQIKWFNNGADWRPENIAGVENKGIEVAGVLWPQSKKYNLALSYTFTDVTKSKAEFTGDKTVGNILPYIPAHSFSATATYFWADFEFGTSLDAQSFRYVSLANDLNTFLPGQTIVSSWAGYTAPVLQDYNLAAWLVVDNLTDVKYQMIAGYPMPPRTYKLTFSINY
jgi:outer membrane cobalamin receptor